MKNSFDDPDDCSNLVVIDTSRIPKSEFPSWVLGNEPYFAAPALGDRQEIDAALIAEDDYARWLLANQLFIVFDITYPYIECVHLITDETEIEIVTSAPALDKMIFSDLIAAIESLGASFSVPNYNHYISMSIDTNNHIHLDLANIYNCDSNCFSIPMFHSILHNNPAITGDSELVFKMPDEGRFAGKKITISISEPPNLNKNYDFSQFPP